MKIVKLVAATLLAGIGAALTYFLFEAVVYGAIDAIWISWLNTDARRYLVVPLCVVLTLAYFGVQHVLDKKSEKAEQEGLGAMPKPTALNYVRIIIIGFLSLVAGASLGPEAVLVPACMVLGAYVGKLIAKGDSVVIKLSAAAGMMALFTAFFDSFIIGVLSVALVVKQAGVKLDARLLFVAVLSSLSAWVTLDLIESKAFVELPHYNWALNIETVVLSAFLIMGGFVAIIAMDQSHKIFTKLKDKVGAGIWWRNALLASFGLCLLYLLGGPLVQFTGNDAIIPMFKQAAELGLLGLLWILLIKVLAISWSKALGYRGGLIFPTLFVAAVLVAIVQLYFPDYNLVYGLVAGLIGAFVANSKTRILA